MYQICFRNQQVDLADGPLYMEIGTTGLVVNRLTKKIISEASLNAAMTAENYTPKTGEIGPMTVEQDTLYDGVWDDIHGGSGAQPPVTQNVQAAAAGGGTNTVTVTLTFASGTTAAKDGSIDVRGLEIGGDGFNPHAVPFHKGDTLAAIATALAAELDGTASDGGTLTLDAAAAAGVVTVTEAGGGGPFVAQGLRVVVA